MAARLLRVTTTNLLKYSKPQFCNNAKRLLATRAATYEQTLQNVPETEVTSLKNGLRIATEDNGAATSTVGLWIDAGSRYESDSNNGSAHLVEHLVFKGTAKRSQAQLEQDIESLGAHLNAYTTREQTAIFAKCLTKDVPKMVEILSDIVQNTKFGDAEVENARNAALRELGETETIDQEVVVDLLHSVAYQGTPLANSVLGPSENLEKLSGKDLSQYVSDNFTAKRMVLAGAGGVAHNLLVDLANQHLSSVSQSDSGAGGKPKPCRFTGSEVRVRDDFAYPLLHFTIAVEGAGWGNLNDHIALQVASTAIGSWDHSHGGGSNVPSLLAEVCATSKYAHSFQSFSTGYRDTGLWGLYYIGDPMQSEDFLYYMQNEWMRLCTQVTESQIERARNQLRTTLMSKLGESSAVCDDIGRQVLYLGRRISPSELDARIQNVSSQVIKDVCMKYIYDRCPAISALGPIEALPDYSRIRGNMAWLRY